MKMSSSLEKRLQRIEDKLDKIIERRTHGNRPQKTHGMKKIAVRTKNDWSLFLRYTYIFITFRDYRIYVQNIFFFHLENCQLYECLVFPEQGFDFVVSDGSQTVSQQRCLYWRSTPHFKRLMLLICFVPADFKVSSKSHVAFTSNADNLARVTVTTAFTTVLYRRRNRMQTKTCKCLVREDRYAYSRSSNEIF